MTDQTPRPSPRACVWSPSRLCLGRGDNSRCLALNCTSGLGVGPKHRESHLNCAVDLIKVSLGAFSTGQRKGGLVVGPRSRRQQRRAPILNVSAPLTFHPSSHGQVQTQHLPVNKPPCTELLASCLRALTAALVIYLKQTSEEGRNGHSLTDGLSLIPPNISMRKSTLRSE